AGQGPADRTRARAGQGRQGRRGGSRPRTHREQRDAVDGASCAAAQSERLAGRRGRRTAAQGRAGGRVMHDLLRVADLDSIELVDLLELAITTKKRPQMYAGIGAGRVCAVLFEK